MLPNVLQPSATDHVPVLADEVREPPRRAAGRDRRRRHVRRRRPRRAARRATSRGSGKLIAIDRDPSVRAVLRPLQGDAPASDAASCAATSRSSSRQLAANDVEADAILLDLGVSSMQLDRPERGFSYADRRAARHADGSLGRADRRASRQRGGRARARRRSSAATARSASRGRSRARSCAAAREQPFERTGELVDVIKRAIPTPARFGEGHPGQARLPGAADRRQRRARRARGRAARRRVEMLRPGRPARRDQLPLARGPDRQALLRASRRAAAPARPTSRSASAARSPSCAR